MRVPPGHRPRLPHGATCALRGGSCNKVELKRGGWLCRGSLGARGGEEERAAWAREGTGWGCAPLPWASTALHQHTHTGVLRGCRGCKLGGFSQHQSSPHRACPPWQTLLDAFGVTEPVLAQLRALREGEPRGCGRHRAGAVPWAELGAAPEGLGGLRWQQGEPWAPTLPPPFPASPGPPRPQTLSLCQRDAAEPSATRCTHASPPQAAPLQHPLQRLSELQ